METVKAHRIKVEREALLWDRRALAGDAWQEYRNANCDLEDILPNPIDIWLWKPVTEIIEQPSGVNVTKLSFKHVLRGLPAFVKSWQEEKMSQLIRIAHGLDLQRATCVFTCAQDAYHYQYSNYDEDAEPCMWFPEFIHHPCNALGRCRWSGDEEEKPRGLDSCKIMEAHKEVSGCRRRQWSTRWLFFDDKASRTVKNILDACGMPSTTTVQEMDEADPRLVCLKCSFGAKCDGERIFSVLTWRNAASFFSRLDILAY